MRLPGRRRAVVLLPLIGVALAGAVVLGTWLRRENGTPAPTRALDGHAIFEAHCAVCHGSTGRGDGPGATLIRQKMMDFTDAAAMRGVKDGFLFEIIQKGSSQFGRSNAMPAWGMKLTDEEIRAVVAYIRSLASGRRAAPPRGKDTP